MAKEKSFIASDGKLQIKLTLCEEGGYLVTCPIDPELITEAETLEEAFNNAHDALAELAKARKHRNGTRNKKLTSTSTPS
jgi:antitoxin HicB